ncbi:MAG: hypothetical protein FJ095_21500 [Deltaproteobacteria bacterium]|nr:hypothetical protein [Deltaproteobacteria bacterium]
MIAAWHAALVLASALAPSSTITEPRCQAGSAADEARTGRLLERLRRTQSGRALVAARFDRPICHAAGGEPGISSHQITLDFADDERVGKSK